MLPIEEIGPDGNRSIGLPLLLTDGGGVIDLKSHTKSKLPMEIGMKKLKHQFENTYSAIGDFVLGVDHAAICEGRSAEQVFLPFCPPLLVRLSDEGGWNPL